MFRIDRFRCDTLVRGEAHGNTDLLLSTGILTLTFLTPAFPNGKKQVMEDDQNEMNDTPTDSPSLYSDQSAQLETDVILRVESVSGKNLKVQCAAACLPASVCSAIYVTCALAEVLTPAISAALGDSGHLDFFVHHDGPGVLLFTT